MNLLSVLRITAILEGFSYIAFGITMPLKYMYDMVLPNKIVGQIHGFLFVLFCFLVVWAFIKYKWSFKKTFILGLSSLIPFGTFWAERKYLKADDPDNILPKEKTSDL